MSLYRCTDYPAGLFLVIHHRMNGNRVLCILTTYPSTTGTLQGAIYGLGEFPSIIDRDFYAGYVEIDGDGFHGAWFISYLAKIP